MATDYSNITPEIVKVVIRQNYIDKSSSNLKLVFVGDHTTDIKQLLGKLEKHQPLSKAEETELNNAIPYWKTKFGWSLDDVSQLKFVHTIINETIPAKQFILYIMDILKEYNLNDDYICYSYPRNIFYSEIYELAAYIFYKLGETTINIKAKDIKAKCKQLYIGDVSMLDNIDNSLIFTQEELIANKSFQDFFRSIPRTLGSRHYLRKELPPNNIIRELYTFESVNILTIGEHAASNNIYDFTFEDQQAFLTQDSSRLEDILDYRNISNNNTFYLIPKKPLLSYIQDLEKKDSKTNTNLKPLIDTYIISLTKTASELQQLNRHFFNTNIQPGILNNSSKKALDELVTMGKISKALSREILDNPVLQVGDIYLKNWVWSGYDIGIDAGLDLINIFRDIEPNNYLPIVKYITDGEVQLYNIYKPFFRNIDERIISRYLVAKDRIQKFSEEIRIDIDKQSLARFKQLGSQDYIILKWRLDESNILNIYLFMSGFLLCEFDTANYLNEDKVLNLAEITNKIFGRIKNKYKLGLDLPDLNPNKLIRPTTGNIYYAELINVYYKLVCNILPKVLTGFKSWTDIISGVGLMDKLKTRMTTLTNIIVLPGSFSDKIKFIYTGTYGFYSPNNIKYYIQHYIQKKDNKLTKSAKEALYVNCQRLFGVTKEIIDGLIKELEAVPVQQSGGLLFHTNCELELVKGSSNIALYINVQNSNATSIIRGIIQLLDGLIKDILFGTEFIYAGSTSIPTTKDDKRAPAIPDLDKMNIADFANINLEDFNMLALDMDLPPEMELGNLELDIDMDLVNKLQALEDEKLKLAGATADTAVTKDGTAEDTHLQDIKLKQIIGKPEKKRVVNYMTDMRRMYDAELFEPTIKGKKGSAFMYDRVCPQTRMRQPFIVSKEELKAFDDPESITGYLKYKGNYYICPRIWDARANKPISVKAFIANKLRSPYTGGESVTAGPTKNLITDKYTVIIRKPTTDKYWQDSSKHKDWPEELKGTEKDAFPALTYSSKHPNKCVPCCGINEPADYDVNKQVIQQFFKPYGFQRCNYKPERDDVAGGDDVIQDEEQLKFAYCKNDEYIGNGATALKNKNCRLALLPEELNLLLNNAQELFTNATETALNDGANLFLRRGVLYNNVTNIFDTFASLFEMRTDKLISLIINKLHPVEFINLNNGALVNIFATSAELPITPGEKQKFNQFLKFYPELLQYLNVDGEHVINALDGLDIKDISQAKLLYKICTGFYNYLGYLQSPNEVKNIEYVLELFSKSHKWMPASGMNILIFDKTVSQLKCLDTFNNRAKQLIFLIEEEKDVYIPVVHVLNKFGKLTVNGIINLDDSINLNTIQTGILYKKKPTQTKLIESARDRLNNIIKLLYIQSNLCNYNLVNFFIQLEKGIRKNKGTITTQYQGIGSSAQCEFINLANADIHNIIIPIYPTKLIKTIYPADYTKLHEDILSSGLDIYKYVELLYDVKRPYLNNDSSDMDNMSIESVADDTIVTKGKKARAKSYYSSSDQAELKELDDAYITEHPFAMLLTHGYNIRDILVDNIPGDKSGDKYICGIEFDNGLQQSVIPTKYDAREFGKLRGLLYELYHITIRVKFGFTVNLLKLGGDNKKMDIPSKELISNTAQESIFNLFAIVIELIKNKLSQFIGSQQKNPDIVKLTDLLVGDTAPNMYKILELLDVVLNKYILEKKPLDLISYIKLLTSTTGFTKTNKELTRKRINSMCVIASSTAQKTKKVSGLDLKKSGLCFQMAGSNNIKVIVPLDLYPVMLLSLAKDIINNKLDTDKIIKGKYIIPVNDLYLSRLGTASLNITNTFMTNLIISPDELAFYINKNVISKYKKNYKLEPDTLELDHLININNEDVAFLKDYVIKNLTQRLTSMLGLASILSSISSSSKMASSYDKENIIKTTIFNSQGIQHPGATYGSCVFPARDKKGAIVYKCTKARDLFKTVPAGVKAEELVCATSLNKDKTAKTWGYCPEQANESLTRLNKGLVTDIYDPDKPYIKSGTCSFPFIYYNSRVVNPLTGDKPLLKISFNCEDDSRGTWCYTKTQDTELNTNNILIGAVDVNKVYKGDWSMGPLENNKQPGTLINLNGKQMEEIAEKMNYKYGVCSQKDDVTIQKQIESHLDLKGVKEIASINDYNPAYCKLTGSKKGYSKQQLYLFGKNILKIPFRLLLGKNNRILNKPELCALCNEKLRDLKKAQLALITDNGMLDYSQIYTKDPAQCEEGQTKGGYKLTELQDMAITFFGLEKAKAEGMLKKELCDFIIPKLSPPAIVGGLDDNNTGITNEVIQTDITKEPIRKLVNPDDIYPASQNINLCSKPIKRGGLSKSAVTKIARKYFGIDTSTVKDKATLCTMIKDGIEKLRTENKDQLQKTQLLTKRKDAPTESIIDNKDQLAQLEIKDAEFGLVDK